MGSVTFSCNSFVFLGLATNWLTAILYEYLPLSALTELLVAELNSILLFLFIYLFICYPIHLIGACLPFCYFTFVLFLDLFYHRLTANPDEMLLLPALTIVCVRRMNFLNFRKLAFLAGDPRGPSLSLASFTFRFFLSANRANFAVHHLVYDFLHWATLVIINGN